MFGLETLLTGKAKEAAEGLVNGVTSLVRTFHLPPEEAVKLEQQTQQMVNTFVTTMLQIVADDRKSAREMAMARPDDHTARNLTYTYTAMFIALMVFNAIIGVLHIEIGGYAQRSFDQFTGVLFAFVTSSKEYYLGTSMSEVSAWMQEKWKTMRGAEKQP